jgi:hypothetical protein
MVSQFELPNDVEYVMSKSPLLAPIYISIVVLLYCRAHAFHASYVTSAPDSTSCKIKRPFRA